MLSGLTPAVTSRCERRELRSGGARCSAAFAHTLWPSIKSDQSTAKRSELGWSTGFGIDLSLPTTPPGWSAVSLPAFDAFLAIGVRPLGVHGYRQGDTRPDATVPAALMRQPTIPDHEIASSGRYLDDAMCSHIDRGVDYRTWMLAQVAIQVSED